MIRIIHQTGREEQIVVNPDRIDYNVVDNGKIIWTREVKFGRDKQHRAGGPAFVDAANACEQVASEV